MEDFFKTLVFLSTVTVIAVGFFYTLIRDDIKTINSELAIINAEKTKIVKDESTTLKLDPPIDNFEKRITKKPFGLNVSPKNSPVKPEKFSGYHTGVDFEVLPGEEKKEIRVFAVCDGPLILKREVSGYGGTLVQQCSLDNKTVTIVYGHIKLSSAKVRVKENLKAGDELGVLGSAYSKETGGERKHLHLGIHLGSDVNLLGYVQDKSELNKWLDPKKYLKS